MGGGPLPSPPTSRRGSPPPISPSESSTIGPTEIPDQDGEGPSGPGDHPDPQRDRGQQGKKGHRGAPGPPGPPGLDRAQGPPGEPGPTGNGGNGEDRERRDALAREAKLEIRKPDSFDGSHCSLWRTFVSDCIQMFTAKPTLYESEASRVTFASLYLTGAAARYYQNLVERELMQNTYLAALHNWRSFVLTFGRLFGVHEQLYSQAALDRVHQRANETFADFLVRFEDTSLLTQYNEPALRWRLLLQIRKDLRSQLTLTGNIPQGFNDVVDRLLDLDTAREAFNEAGITTNVYANPMYVATTVTPPNTQTNQQNAQAGPGPTTQANRNRNRSQANRTTPTARAVNT
ncbi:hypothetical protein D9758_018870 [Tetrapyrgos nigripes]|uniref:Retrotransposon gag domain-containing protein n=1 Tax=Tetrapyrgos nigripes TaxID=182062 RepID=A0A8H5F1H2_9AGAR|nr:hypothetical protein D9758_018870 [Tetrapyrgos nigripes]